jgi:hypothetical protein
VGTIEVRIILRDLGLRDLGLRDLGLRDLGRKAPGRKRRAAVQIGKRIIPTAAVATTTVRLEIRTRARMTTAEATGTIVHRVLTGNKRRPRHRRTCRTVCAT